MSVLHLQEIFPTASSVRVFIIYVIVCLQQALLVTASRTPGKETYPYNPATVVMLTEVLKLIMSTMAYLRRYFLHLLPIIQCHLQSSIKKCIKNVYIIFLDQYIAQTPTILLQNHLSQHF